MRAAFATLDRVARSDATVLLDGETGTGKGAVAEALHAASPRKDRPFVVVDCAVLSPTLLQSELFGHERGAFTGADARRIGAFEEASGGTIFLDEIGELPAEMQPRLLRVLENRAVRRIGQNRYQPVDVRIIAATNRDLLKAVRDQAFREDLYYRLSVFPIALPRLSERREDISVLADYFLAKASRKCRTRVKSLSAEALACLMHYDWPGNVRELENALERALVLGSTDSILPDDLPEAVLEAASTTMAASDKYHGSIKEAKKQLILQALQQANGNYIEAARTLGMQHARRGHDELQRQRLDCDQCGQRAHQGNSAKRSATRDRAVHACGWSYHSVRNHDRRSQHLHETMESGFSALQGCQCSGLRIRMP